MKNISITGRLTKDCEVKEKLVRFAVAVDGFENGAKKTEFFEVALFGQRGQSAAQYLKKGQTVSLSGDFSTFSSDQGRTYLKIKTNDVTLAGPAKSDEPRQEPRQTAMSSAMEDDIPFMMEWR